MNPALRDKPYVAQKHSTVKHNNWRISSDHQQLKNSPKSSQCCLCFCRSCLASHPEGDQGHKQLPLNKRTKEMPPATALRVEARCPQAQVRVSLYVRATWCMCCLCLCACANLSAYDHAGCHNRMSLSLFIAKIKSYIHVLPFTLSQVLLCPCQKQAAAAEVQPV